jgi:putative DNA primase/helicase
MQVLQGVSFGSIVNKQNYIAINENSKPDTQQLPHQESLVNQDFHTNHTSFNNFVETENQENDL